MSAPRKAKRKDYLSRENQKLEQQILYTLSRDEKKLSSAVIWISWQICQNASGFF
jgi:hypothetical protein